MDVRINQSIVDAIRKMGHVPDTLKQRFDAIAPAGDGFVLKLSEDDAMALAELVQWHIKTDPATGKATADTAPYEDLIARIDAAQFE